MEDKTSKQERDAARKDKHFLRQATGESGDSYMKDVLDDLEDRPEEVSWKEITLQFDLCIDLVWLMKLMDGWMNEYKQIRELFGESREERKYIAQYERQQEVEENLFTRATRTKEDKRREKRLKLRSGYVWKLLSVWYFDWSLCEKHLCFLESGWMD